MIVTDSLEARHSLMFHIHRHKCLGPQSFWQANSGVQDSKAVKVKV